mmetsp:Transcript_38953/g.80892  ORF Transcript_38953/g.80892 Transcript_38953/m.80892 type:complete len:444 (-) Transcript_38953:171-1502(-)
MMNRQATQPWRVLWSFMLALFLFTSQSDAKTLGARSKSLTLGVPTSSLSFPCQAFRENEEPLPTQHVTKSNPSTNSLLPSSEKTVASSKSTRRRKRKSTMLASTKSRGGAAVAAPAAVISKPSLGLDGSSRKAKSALLDGLRSGMASGMAAVCVKTLLQPLDAIKTLQQFQQAKAGAGERALSTLGAARVLLNRPGGVANFYAGLGVTVVGAIPGVALYFGVYQFCKNKFLTQTEWGAKRPRVSIALSAAIGNSIASCSRTPYEVLKQKLQMGTYPTFGAAARAVMAHPMEALFPKGGVLIQTVRDVPYAVVSLLVYESLQEAFRTRDMTTGRKKKWDFFIGGVSGGVGSWVSNPMDVIKTRLQTDSTNQYGGSVVKCTSMLWQEGGAAAFLRGSVPRLMHKIPANCFFFFFYETFRRLLNADSPTAEDAATKTRAKKQTKTQ